jgi:hypothetical protein
MSSTQLRNGERARPFVAVVCAVPLLGEAVRAALDFADVRTFAAAGGDLDGLVRWLGPDVLIVDSEAVAEQAVAFARDREVPVLHISVQDPVLRLYRRGAWEVVGTGDDVTPEASRNVVAGVLFAREEAPA